MVEKSFWLVYGWQTRYYRIHAFCCRQYDRDATVSLAYEYQLRAYQLGCWTFHLYPIAQRDRPSETRGVCLGKAAELQPFRKCSGSGSQP